MYVIITCLEASVPGIMDKPHGPKSNQSLHVKNNQIELDAQNIVPVSNMNMCMENPTICIGENKGADQLCSNYMDSTIPLLHIPKISSLQPASVTVQTGLCQTGQNSKLLVFSCTGSYIRI